MRSFSFSPVFLLEKSDKRRDATLLGNDDLIGEIAFGDRRNRSSRPLLRLNIVLDHHLDQWPNCASLEDG